MPDDKTKMIFPEGVPIQKDDGSETETREKQIISKKSADASKENMSQENLFTQAEGDLHNNEEN